MISLSFAVFNFQDFIFGLHCTTEPLELLYLVLENLRNLRINDKVPSH